MRMGSIVPVFEVKSHRIFQLSWLRNAMPDFSSEAVRQFWSAYEDPMIYRVITFMEGVESWTLDGDEDLETALNELGKELDDIANVEG